jgi:hypothetical protein
MISHMRYIELDNNQLDQINHLKSGDSIEINDTSYRIKSINIPRDDDVVFIFTDEGNCFIQNGRLSFTKQPKRFPWISWPMKIWKVKF